MLNYRTTHKQISANSKPTN